MTLEQPLASGQGVWQDVEFGAFAADLPLWEELAAAAGGPVLELGSGSGRVALHLAKKGDRVIAVERDPEMVEALAARADGLPMTVLQADLVDLGAEWTQAGLPEPGVAIAPLHIVQQLDPNARPALLAALAGLLPAGARAAFVLVDEGSLLADGFEGQPEVPAMRDVGGWVYSSEPLWVQVDERVMTARRLRERVSPSGEIERSIHDDVLHRITPDQLEAEADAAGLRPTERRAIESGPVEADSVVVIAEARA